MHTPCTSHAHLAQHWMRVIDLLRGWDKDGDGIVSKPEFVKALKTLGFKFELETAAQLFAEFDADGSGEIDLKELKRKILEADKVVETRRDVDGPEEAAAAAAAAAPTLTSLDLADNQLGGGALGPLLRGLRAGACALRALDLSRNRLPERAYTCTWTWTWTCIMRHAPCALPTYILPTPCRHPADIVPTRACACTYLTVHMHMGMHMHMHVHMHMRVLSGVDGAAAHRRPWRQHLAHTALPRLGGPARRACHRAWRCAAAQRQGRGPARAPRPAR